MFFFFFNFETHFTQHLDFITTWNFLGYNSDCFLFQVPFILIEGGHWPWAGYVVVNMDGSAHPLPLTTVYHQLLPVHASSYTFFRAMFGHGYPVSF